MFNNTTKLTLSEAFDVTWNNSFINSISSSETAKKAQSMLSKVLPAKDNHMPLIENNLNTYGLYIEYFGITQVLLMSVYRLLMSPNLIIELVSLQMIFSDDHTIYLKVTPKTGCFSIIGKPNFQNMFKIIFCESYVLGAARMYDKCYSQHVPKQSYVIDM